MLNKIGGLVKNDIAQTPAEYHTEAWVSFATKYLTVDYGTGAANYGPAVTDAIVLRAFFRTFNLLCAPDAMVKDTDVFGRVLAVWQDRANRPPEPLLGPATRADLLVALAG